MKTCSFPLSVLRARQVLNGAESTCVQQSCNNAQVSADRAVKFPHAESFASCTSNSLIEFKRKQSAASRPFSQLQGEISEMGQYPATITDKGYSPLLRPSLNGHLLELHICSAK